MTVKKRRQTHQQGDEKLKRFQHIAHSVRRHPGWLKSLLAACALAIVAAIAGNYLLKYPLASTQRLLERAYAERRTMELRIAGAEYAPLRLERGGHPWGLDRSAPLIRAESRIIGHIDASSPDPDWLQAKARADLLEHQYDSAIHSLQEALEIKPDSLPLLVDLASGFFERAQADDRPIDYGNAIEYLGEVLAKAPDNPVALFNRAIACEKMFLYTQALDDWSHYLEVDGHSAWTVEARHRQEALQQTISSRQQRISQTLLAPAQVAKTVSQNNSLEVLEPRIEEYLGTALTDWLPAAYPVLPARNGETTEARVALRALAEWSRKKHNDVWLADLLAGASSPNFPAAINALARALNSDDAGDTAEAQRLASRAAALFKSGHNTAGILRAQVEYVFAGHVAQEGENCLHAAARTAHSLSGHHYPWLQTQLHLEEGTCFWLTGNMGQARILYEQAAREAQLNGYNTLFLRSQDHLASLDVTTGNFTASWQRIQAALSRFWVGSYPSMRGYNLYYDLHESARIRKQPQLQVASWSSGVRLSESFRDNNLRAMAHSLMADAAISASENRMAEAELKTADELFKHSPRIHATRVAQMEAETRLAEVELRRGDWQQAAQRLKMIQPEISTLKDSFLSLLFYTNIGDAQAQSRQNSEAERSLESAILFAEQDLGSLRDEQSRMEWSQKSSRAYSELIQLKLDAGDETTALELFEWYRGAPLRSAEGRQMFPPGANKFPSLNEVASHLPSLTDETIISYGRMPKGFVAWVYDNRGITFRRIQADPARIAHLARNFRRLCSDRTSNIKMVRGQGHTLYDLLVAPLESSLDAGRSLVIEADDELTGIPFEALIDHDGHYLGERGPMVASLGIYYRHHLRPALPITPDTPALIAAVPVTTAFTDQPLLPLANALDEANEVARKFHSPEILRGREADLNAVRSLLPKAAVFHFAGHALASPGQSGLVLADALLTYHSIHKVDLSRMQMAVLSACDTVGGLEEGNYNPDSLVRFFATAGVPHFVASRWNVDSEATRSFMNAFYTKLLQGKTVSAALYESRAWLRAQAGTQHPYYWAAFSAFGAE